MVSCLVVHIKVFVPLKCFEPYKRCICGDDVVAIGVIVFRIVSGVHSL